MNGEEAAEFPRLRYRNLLEKADLQASRGEIEEAIGQVREALSLATDPHVISSIEDHLRLPHLLQRAGRMEEAQEEFYRLLEEGHPDQPDNRNVQWMDRALIHNAMRRACAREQRPAEAALHEALGYLAEGYGRFLDSGEDEQDLQEGFLSEATARAAAKNMAGRLPESPAGGAEADEIAELLIRTLRQFGHSDPEELLQEAERHLRHQLPGTED